MALSSITEDELKHIFLKNYPPKNLITLPEKIEFEHG